MAVSFTPRFDWVDLPSRTTPFESVDVLRYEHGINDVVTDLNALETTVASLQSGGLISPLAVLMFE